MSEAFNYSTYLHLEELGTVGSRYCTVVYMKMGQNDTYRVTREQKSHSIMMARMAPLLPSRRVKSQEGPVQATDWQSSTVQVHPRNPSYSVTSN